MASFGNHFEVTSNRSIIGTSYSDDQSLLTITKNENSVSLYKVEDRKVVKEYAFKLGSKFTSPVVFHESAEIFLAVQNSKVLRQWSLDDENINNCQKIKFTSSINRILTWKNEEPLILFDNGSFKSYNDAILNPKDLNLIDYLKPDEAIVWASFIHEDSTLLVFIVVKSSKTDSLTFHAIGNKDGEQIHTTKDLCLNGKHILSFTVISYESKCFIYFIDSSGRLNKSDLDDIVEPSVIGRFNINDSSKVSLKSVDKNNLFIAGILNDEGKSMCIVWDLKYSIEKARKCLPSNLKTSDLCLSDDILFLMCESGIVGVEFEIEIPRLASILGKVKLQKEPEKFPVISWDTPEIKEKVDSTLKNISVKSASIINSEVIQNMIEENNLIELENYFSKNTHFSESDIASVLQYLLSEIGNFDDVNEENIQQKKEISFLNRILGLSFNSIFLVDYLHDLSLNQSLTLLQYLDFLIFSDGVELFSNSPSSKKVIDWISVILDSHLNQLLMTSDPKVITLLSNFNLKVQNEYKFCKDLLKLDQQLHNVEMKYELPKVRVNSSYSIVVMEL